MEYSSPTGLSIATNTHLKGWPAASANQATTGSSPTSKRPRQPQRLAGRSLGVTAIRTSDRPALQPAAITTGLLDALLDPGVHGSVLRCHRPAQPAGSAGRETDLCRTGCVVGLHLFGHH